MYKLFFILSISIVLVSCQKENTYSVDANLQPYFKQFEQEAALRNQNIDLEAMQILGKIQNIEEKNVPGQCQYFSKETWVVIDPEYWNKMDNWEKEALIFHELGHAALHRQHLDTKGSHGICKSIMHSSSGVCKSIYNQATQKQYLDELFE